MLQGTSGGLGLHVVRHGLEGGHHQAKGGEKEEQGAQVQPEVGQVLESQVSQAQDHGVEEEDGAKSPATWLNQ